MSINQSYLTQILDYNKETGEFTWKTRESANKSWNAKWPGKKAGKKNASGHISIAIHRIRYYAHRLAWLYVYGEWPSGDIDHINGIKKDNSIKNLREATKTQNNRNIKKRKTNKIGLKGVHLNNNRWRASISVNRKTIHIGYYDTPEKAHEAYCLKARELHGDFFAT